MRKTILVALAVGTFAASAVPAFALPAQFDAGLTRSAPSVDLVQFRGEEYRHHGGGRGFQGGGRRFGGGDRHWRRGGGGYGYGRGYGYGVGAGVAGLAAGALIGGAIASQAAPDYAYEAAPAPVAGDTEGYCMQRYKSYDQASGTFLGYDGMRHPCP